MARIANHTSEETKNNIKNAFLELYKEKDINKITVNMLCQKAGINRGTFYYYYSDIYDLILNIETHALIELSKIFPIIINGMLFDEFDNVEKITEFLEDTGDVFVLFCETRPNLHFQQEIRRFETDYLIKRLNVEMYDLSLKQQCILEYLIHGQIGSMVWWIKSDRSIPIDKFLKIIYNVNRNGPMAMLFEEHKVENKN